MELWHMRPMAIAPLDVCVSDGVLPVALPRPQPSAGSGRQPGQAVGGAQQSVVNASQAPAGGRPHLPSGLGKFVS